MNTITKINPVILFLGAALIVAAALFSYRSSPVSVGSTPRGGEYQGTSTQQTYFNPETVLLTTSGVLGSVVITGTSGGVVNLYDATTSNINFRTGQAATSSLFLASFPANAATGTYTFDRNVYSGLYVSVVGTIPTTTITFRP